MPASTPSNSLADHLAEPVLAEALQHSLRSTLFSSGLTVSPRQVNKVGADIASAFLVFFENQDVTAVQADGSRLAHAGLGHRSILTMTETLRQVCREKSNPLFDLPNVAGVYVNALLEGYMAGREELVLQEQQRTVQAYIRASAQREDETG